MLSSVSCTELYSPDTSITKCEVFDVDFAKQLLDDKGICKEEKEKLKRYFKNKKYDSKTNQYYHETTYKLGKHCKHEFLGRLCAMRGESLQALGKNIRNAISGYYYWDLDFINAQPTLLKQYADKNNWKADATMRYIEEREELLSEICELQNIERWEAKDKVISIFFGCGVGAIEGMPSFFTDELYPEMRKIMKNNWDLNKASLKWLEKQPNCVGKGMADILQTEERKCLIALDRALAKKGRSLDVLIHDGGLVRKSVDEKEFPVSVLRELEVEIEKETGYKMRLAVKPMKSIFIKKLDEEDEYVKEKHEFEKTHFKINDPYCIVRIIDKELKYCSETDFRAIYGNKFINEEESFVSRWLKDPMIRTYEKLVFELDDSQVPEDCYNIFQGWSCEPVEGDITAVNEILSLICNHNPKLMYYIERWIASIIQRKVQKTSKSIVCRGDQGVGKDTFFDFVASMFGNYSFNTTTPETDVFGSFNSHLMQVVFLKFEEANFSANKANDTKMKGLITSLEPMPFQPKGMKIFRMKSFFNLVMTTNQFCPLILEDTNRRYILIQASSERRGDLPFWTRIHNQLGKKETRQAYMNHLMNLDLSNFNVLDTNDIITDYHKQVVLAERPFHARFLQNAIVDKYTLEWNARDLYGAMKDVCGSKFELTETSFGLAIKVYEGVSMKKERKAHGNRYVFDKMKLIEQLKSKTWWNDEFEDAPTS